MAYDFSTTKTISKLANGSSVETYDIEWIVNEDTTKSFSNIVKAWANPVIGRFVAIAIIEGKPHPVIYTVSNDQLNISDKHEFNSIAYHSIEIDLINFDVWNANQEKEEDFVQDVSDSKLIEGHDFYQETLDAAGIKEAKSNGMSAAEKRSKKLEEFSPSVDIPEHVGKPEEVNLHTKKYALKIEAETMRRRYYRIEKTDKAESGAVIALSCKNGNIGRAIYTTSSKVGLANIYVRYVDENDGVTPMRLYLDNDLIAEWELDADLGENSHDSIGDTNFITRLVAEGIAIQPNQEIKLEATKVKNTLGRVDWIAIDPVEENHE